MKERIITETAPITANSITLVAAMVRHVKLDTEGLPEFRKTYATLSQADRDWYGERFEAEYGYRIVHHVTP